MGLPRPYLSFCFQPVFAAVSLGDQRDGQRRHLLHLLSQQRFHGFPLRFRTLHDQLVVYILDELALIDLIRQLVDDYSGSARRVPA